MSQEYKTTTATTATGSPTHIVKISSVPRAFLVHFRKMADDFVHPSSYEVSRQTIGFDWLRDEYIYDIINVLENDNKPTRLYQGDIDKLKKEYTRLRFSDPEPIEVLKKITTRSPDDYIPAWLAVFADSHKPKAIKNASASLYLQIDQEMVDQDIPLTDDGTLLIFTTSDDSVLMSYPNTKGYQSTLEIPLKDFLKDGQKQRPMGETTYINYYADQSKRLSIKVNTPSDKVRHILVTAKHGKHSRDVGVLLIYPNHQIPTAHIQAVQFALLDTTNLANIRMPELHYTNNLSTAFSQALIQLTFEQTPLDMKLRTLPEEHPQHQKIKAFLDKYTPKIMNDSYPANHIGFDGTDMGRQNRSNFDVEIRDLFEALHPNPKLQETAIQNSWTESNLNKTTYLIFVDVQPVIISNTLPTSATGGVVLPRRLTAEESNCGCFAGGDNSPLNSIGHINGNTAIIYSVISNSIHATFHELGHSFGLPHTFDKPYQPRSTTEENIANNFPVYQFYQGYTDNVMDYGKRIPKDIPETEEASSKTEETNVFFGRMTALFKWQWNILRADRSMTLTS